MDHDTPGIIPPRDQDYPMVGETLGLWRLVRGLGRGGMGEVYEAEYDYIHLLTLRYPAEQRDIIRPELAQLSRKNLAALAQEMLGTSLPSDARFAIKLCNARSGTPGHRRFLQEAELAQRLGDHPYIVSVHGVNGGGLDDNGPAGRLDLDRGKYRDVAFMVMDLAIRTYDHTHLTLAESVHVVRCIASALDHAHRHGIIHRDLKPENILGSVEYPLLTDFGIAKEMDQTDGLTRTGQIIGTLDYMSPEQATDAKRVDHRSDIYSLGVVLYEMATKGCLPYSHKLDRDSCLTAIRSDRFDPRWPREYRQDFPASLERIILKAMSQQQEDRYQGMSELITDLDRYTRGEHIGLFGRVKIKSWARFQLRRRPKLAWSLGGVAAVVMVLVLGLWVSNLLDADRRVLNRQLDRLERVVADISTVSGRGQPDKDEFKLIADIEGGPLKYAGRKYPEERKRFEELTQELRQHRRLVGVFQRKDGRPLNDSEYRAAKDQLSLAIGKDIDKWTLPAPDGGLWVQGVVKAVIGKSSPEEGVYALPFGAGTCYTMLTVGTSSGFSMTITEADAPQHYTTLSLEGERVQFSVTEEGKDPRILFTENLPPGALQYNLSFGIEVRPNEVRLFWGQSKTRAFPGIHGLREGAPALVELHLPRNTTVRSIGIWPNGPR